MLAVCACKKEMSASKDGQPFFDKGIAFQEDFEPISADWLYYNTDTVSSSVVKFIALDSSAVSYAWTIESATYNTKEVRLSFPQDYLLSNKKVTVKLSIRHRAASGADTVQSYVKELTFFNPCASNFNGIFKGRTDGGNQTDSFKIATCANDFLHPAYSLYLDNFQLSCGRYFDELPDSYHIGYKQILFSAKGDFLCNSPSGIMNIVGDSVYISYRSFDNGILEAPLDHVFRGVRK
jgi:hypothetical protein